MIPQQIRLGDMFNTSALIPSLGRFKGLVCFYGRHYIAFFCSLKHRAWYLFDDRRVKVVGTWDNVLKKLVNGKLQPVLLFYELLNVDEKEEEEEDEAKEEEEEEAKEEEEEQDDIPQKLKFKRSSTVYDDDIHVHMPPTSQSDDEEKKSPIVERKLRVRCPSNVKPGMKIQVTWKGRSFSTSVPEGVLPGQTFDITTTASEKLDDSISITKTSEKRVMHFITDDEAKRMHDSDRCDVCRKEYDFIIRRAHHCRHCRRSVCGSVRFFFSVLFRSL